MSNDTTVVGPFMDAMALSSKKESAVKQMFELFELHKNDEHYDAEKWAKFIRTVFDVCK